MLEKGEEEKGADVSWGREGDGGERRVGRKMKTERSGGSEEG